MIVFFLNNIYFNLNWIMLTDSKFLVYFIDV